MKTYKLSLLLSLSFLISLPAFSQSNFEWGLTTGRAKRDEATDLSIDPQGNVYITGTFEDSMDMAISGPKDFLHGYGYRDIFLAKYDPSGSKLWAYAFGDTRFDRSWAMTTDAQGAVYMGGVFGGHVDFDPGSDSSFLTSNPAGFWPDGYLAKYNTQGELVWAKHLLTARNRSASQSATLFGITGIEVDANDDIIIGGMFWDSVWLAPNKLIVSQGSLADMFLAKYDNNGNLIWGIQMGGAGDQRIMSLSVDPQGNIFTTGFYFSNPDFDPAGGTVLSSQGAEDIFLAKYSSAGSLLWAKGFGSPSGSNTSTESGLDVGTDDMGNVYCTGRLLGTVDFDPNSAAGSIVSMGGANFFCTKFDGSGAFQWVFSLEGNGYKIGKRLAVQPNGDFWLGGEYGIGAPLGGLDIDPGPDTVLIYALGGPEDNFVAKYDKDGAFLTGWDIRGLGGSKLEGLAASGNELVLGGYFDASILLNRQSGDLRFSKGDADLFAVKYGQGNMSVENALQKVDFSIFPNPASQQIQLTFSLPKAQSLSFSLYSLDGKCVMTLDQQKSLSSGNQHLSWDLDEELTPGRYLLAIASDQGQKVLPLVIVK